MDSLFRVQMICTGTIRYRATLDGQMCSVCAHSQADFWYPVVSSGFEESTTHSFKFTVL